MSLGFGNMGAGGRRRSAGMQPFSRAYEIVDGRVVFGGHEQREKKRRLSVEEVKYLERSFEMESKLEPERKMQLAFELGISPRQVTVWYQNRRARWKAKQLEKDHNALREQFNALVLETQKLQSEVMRLTRELEEAKGIDQLKELEHVSKNSFGTPTRTSEETDEFSHAKNCSWSCTDAASKFNVSATTKTDCLGEEEEDEKVKTRILQDNISKISKQIGSAEHDVSEEFYDYLMVIADHQATDCVYNIF